MTATRFSEAELVEMEQRMIALWYMFAEGEDESDVPYVVRAVTADHERLVEFARRGR